MTELRFPKPYIPAKLPDVTIQNAIVGDTDLLANIIKNGRKLSEFIGYLQNLPNPEILVSSLTLQEAVLSSRIEGTLATIKDVVNDNPQSETIRNDIVEIENYSRAVHYGYEVLRDTDRGISKNLIKELHVILLENNVRGANKTPGLFKTEQNYVVNDFLGNFTPLPPSLTDEYVDNLVSYITDSNEISEIVQAAVMHAQFEIIHPFKDGNGRVGRLLIPLLLFYKKVLPFPVFYISRYFSENNDEYKLCLSNLSRSDNSTEKSNAWKQWINFFFYGIANESQRHIDTSKAIINLYSEMCSAVNKTDLIPLINLLFDKLKVIPKDVNNVLDVSSSRIYKELHNLSQQGYITRIGSDRKTSYVFTKLIDIVK